MTSEIKYTCGCKFSTTKLEEAVKHSDSNIHIMTVLGTIKPETRKED
ncbi:hypothetical protein LCGC14_1174960 [marine sediment metagenome]|uniref:Uncharacterized protein n=1 Tax=marine sediment metagenome TaxID=412755 RepID=A0A0F9LP15_9ZZZZ